MKTELYWVYLVCGYLVIAVVAGGSSLPGPVQLLSLSWFGLVLLFAAVWRLRSATLNETTTFALSILAAGFCLMFLQLLPLPQGVWSVMGGRGFVVESMDAVHQNGAWLSLSLSPETTRQDIISLMPGAAIFVAMLSVAREHFAFVGLTVACLAAVELIYSFAQPDVAAHGGFVNPNFFAAMLYMSIPFVIAVASRSFNKSLWAFAAGIALLSMVCLAQSGSRLGLLIGIGVGLASVLSLLQVGHKPEIYMLAFLAATTALVLIFGGAGFERFSGLQTAFAARADMFTTSLQAMMGFLPAGSGFGSFVPVYQIYETPASVTPDYVNHAHNDWLELLLEGGLLMAALMVAFLRLYAQTLKAAWNGHSVFGKAACISTVAVMLHSFADYPLRTPALLVLFSCCCGLMVRSAVRSHVTTWNFSAGKAFAV